jgi:hypothetical protein
MDPILHTEPALTERCDFRDMAAEFAELAAHRVAHDRA